jgi:hypothetical protein
MTTCSLFPADTRYFSPGKDSIPQSGMINDRVDHLDTLLIQLSNVAISSDPKREDHEYGRFACIVDPKRNRLNLWQPMAEEK